MRFLLRRLALSLLLAWLVASLVFLAIHLVPGDPAELLLSTGGAAPDADSIAELRTRLGLDRPLALQYASFLTGLLHADLGTSLVDDYPVLQEIALRLPRTLELIAAATILASALGIPAGTAAALAPESRFARLASGASALMLAVPVFVLGTLSVLLFAQTLHLLPAGGYVPFPQSPARHLSLLAMPAIAIATGLTAILFRTTRSAVRDTMHEDHVRTAHAKGLTRPRVLSRHILRNALSPILTMLGLHMGALLGGTVLVEYVFNWPGLSTPLLRAVEARDYPMVTGIVLVVAFLFLAINLATDLARAALDPRIRTA